MTIANREEVAMLQTHNVWVSNVGILVDLVGVMGRDTSLGRKRELCDDIHDFLLFCGATCPFFLFLTFTRLRRMLLLVRRIFY